MSILKQVIIAVFIALLAVFYILDFGQYLSLASLKQYRDLIHNYYEHHQILVIFIYMLTYITTIALSMPTSLILTLSAGLIFGSFVGTIIAAISAPIGATLAFFIARYTLRDVLEKKYGHWLEKINRGLEENGFTFILFTRIAPFPFFITNLVYGLTRVKVSTYFIATFIGMLLPIFVFTNLSSQVSQIDSIKDILSTKMLLSFLLVALLTLIPIGLKQWKKKR